jgi:hypothetical protein
MIKLKGILHSCLTATIWMIVLWCVAVISTLIVIALPLEWCASYLTSWVEASPPLQYQFLSVLSWLLSYFVFYKEETLLALAYRTPFDPNFSQQLSKILFLVSDYFLDHFIEIFSALFTITWLSQNTGILCFISFSFSSFFLCFFFTVIRFHFPDWLRDLFPQSFDPLTYTYSAFSSNPTSFFPSFGNDRNEVVDYDSLPPLEEIDPSFDHLLPAGEEGGSGRSGEQKEWYVFDPVFGVIPSETRDLWLQQEAEREAQRQNAIKSPKKAPPIRFSGMEEETISVEYEKTKTTKMENGNQYKGLPIDVEIPYNRADDKCNSIDDLMSPIPLERSISGFETVGID